MSFWECISFACECARRLEEASRFPSILIYKICINILNEYFKSGRATTVDTNKSSGISPLSLKRVVSCSVFSSLRALMN